MITAIALTPFRLVTTIVLAPFRLIAAVGRFLFR